MPFSPEELELIAATGEVRIETHSGDRLYRTIIWVVAQDETVYVRSVRGKSGRWYQRAIADPEVALHIGDTRIPAKAIPATDAESVERASQALRQKYPSGQSLESMVRPQVLDTTLRLEPAS